MNDKLITLVGPISELLTLDGLSLSGPITDKDLIIIRDAGIFIQNSTILKIGKFTELKKQVYDHHIPIDFPSVCLPGFIDAHTHICFAGSRANDYALRLSGYSYQEIAKQGGGILDTVKHTRKATLHELVDLMIPRLDRLLALGVTTCEVKSGYGLNLDDELKMLYAIKKANSLHLIDLIPTCLAAHIPPKDYDCPSSYLRFIENSLLPIVQKENLSDRVDIFVEEGAFSVEEAKPYLLYAKKLGFSLTIHADQFSSGGALLAKEVGALSCDHLEASSENDLLSLKTSKTIPIVLPGASLGLGIPFAPARKILDLGLPLAIASDWNPGSAPQGDLLTQAALLGCYQKLTMAETFAAITFRAAAALNLYDRGVIRKGQMANFSLFSTNDWREILYYQGSMKPKITFVKGIAHSHFS